MTDIVDPDGVRFLLKSVVSADPAHTKSASAMHAKETALTPKITWASRDKSFTVGESILSFS